MKRTAFILSLALLAAPSALFAESSTLASNQSSSLFPSLGAAEFSAEGVTGKFSPSAHYGGTDKPFSRIAFGAGVSPLGINLMAATNLNRYLNVRATGNIFKYTINDLSTNGFTVDAKLNLASVGVSLDYYPFPKHGFRLSPGILFNNTNGADVNFTAQPGTSFSLDDFTYYSSQSNPVHGIGNVGLHKQNPAFTITSGWGNIIPRADGHWSFPFEVGVALIGDPVLNLALNSGQVCDAQGQNCVDVATDPDVQANLQAQIVKYRNDIEPLKTYPILSFGVGYSFHVRKVQ